MAIVFSNERKLFDTVLEGTTLVLKGKATVGGNKDSFDGQIYRKDNNEYVGDYSQTSLSIADSTRMDYMIEAATQLTQLSKDVIAKAAELSA